MINKVVLMGRLTKIPELKYTKNDKAVCSFTIAVERNTADRTTDFIDLVAWNKTAEFITKFFTKGSMIAIVGKIQVRSYLANDGQKRKVTEIVVDECHFCGRESKSGNDEFVDVTDDEHDLPF